MEVINGLEEVSTIYRQPVVTIGFFDGVHLGHRMLLTRLVAAAKEKGGTSVVMTFDRHPQELLGEWPPFYLTTLEERKEKLANLGIDVLVIIKFDGAFAKLGASQFVWRILCERLKTEKLIVGADFKFGYRRSGDVKTLLELGKGCGFSVEVLEPLRIQGLVVSSTVIRELIKEGEVDKAAELLGYPYSLEGEVVSGDNLGKSLGFPTANLEVTEIKVIPARGVYACSLKIGEHKYNGLVNIGIRPTISGRDSRIEVYVIDFEGNIYGQKLRVSFIRRLRGEFKFVDVLQLSQQIARDVEEAKSLLQWDR